MQEHGFFEQEEAQTLAQDGFSASLSGGAAGTLRAREAVRSGAACQMAARRVLELADNGDGMLTVVRCADPSADDLDIQFEAGGCPVTAIAPRAFEGCSALRRVVLPEGLR